MILILKLKFVLDKKIEVIVSPAVFFIRIERHPFLLNYINYFSNGSLILFHSFAQALANHSIQTRPSFAVSSKPSCKMKVLVNFAIPPAHRVVDPLNLFVLLCIVQTASDGAAATVMNSVKRLVIAAWIMTSGK